MANKKAIGVYGVSTGSFALAQRLSEMARSVAVCGQNRGPEGSEAAGSAQRGEIAFCPGLDEFTSALGTPARIFSFHGYSGYLEEARLLLSSLKEGDIVFESNAFPFEAMETVRSEFAKSGVAWIPVKLAFCPESDGMAGVSVLASRECLDDESRDLLMEIAGPKTDKRPRYAELSGPGPIAAARSTYRGLLDITLQGFADVYCLMYSLLKLSPFEARMTFAEWGKSELDSPVLRAVGNILGTMDETGEAALARILDTIKLDSGDRDSLLLSLSFNMPPPLASAAFAARVVSALRDERLGASVSLIGAKGVMPLGKEFLGDLRDALIASLALALAQSLAYFPASLGDSKGREAAAVASAWAGASLLQGPLLENAAAILSAQETPKGLLFEPAFHLILNRCQSGLRRTAAAIAEAGIPAPVLSSALTLYDSFRSERLSSNLVAAGLDYFFGIGFERVDRPRAEKYHLDWKGDGSLTRIR